MSGQSSVLLSLYFSQASQFAQPTLVSTNICLLVPLMQPGSRDSREGFLFCMSTTMPLLASMVYSISTRSLYSAAFTASMWTMAWMDLPPLVTIAAMGRFSLRYILYCASSGIVSDSISANL